MQSKDGRVEDLDIPGHAVVTSLVEALDPLITLPHADVPFGPIRHNVPPQLRCSM